MLTEMLQDYEFLKKILKDYISKELIPNIFENLY